MMKTKEGYLLRMLGTQPMVVATGPAAQEFKGIVRLHGVGAFLWEQLTERDCTEADLVEALLAEYDVDRETAETDVAAFVKTISDEGFVE